MSILDKIHASNDVKRLGKDELPALCGELRDKIIQTVSKTGGHLSSNLGTVELSVALHRVYDSAKDRIVFDVGHQSYSHKLLTGRARQFSTLRQYGGLSGFPKPYEAEDDACIAGHASNAISVALGMARARSRLKQGYDIVAVIGDGAMSGGLAFEGLTNAAASGEPMLIILNDNNMSISENVGGTASLLQQMRARPGYISFKRWYRETLSKTPRLYRFNHSVKEWIKSRLLQDNMFTEMGLDYLGPVDGHDLLSLETAIRYARDTRKTVLLHVLTKKGKGCRYAEREPERYHGPGSFDPVSGALPPAKPCFSTEFGKALTALAQEEPRVTAITAAMCAGTGLDVFKDRFPERFYDVGIAEGHSISMAAGMAKQGLIPVVAVYSSFLQRAYDMLIHDVSLQGLHVVLGVDRAGLVGSDGETHHGVFDVSFLSSVPGLSVWCPASFAELRDMLRHAVIKETGPVAVRYPRGGEGRYTDSHLEEETLLAEGGDLTLVCYGSMVNTMLTVVERLKEQGVKAALVKLNRIRPNRFEVCLRSLRETGRLLAAEEVCAAGCIGRQLLSAAAEQGFVPETVRLMNLGDGIVPHGTVEELLTLKGLDADSITSAALSVLGKGEANE